MTASLCRKAGKKKSILTRLSNFVCTSKKRVLMKAFIKSQFNYRPLIWMFHSKGVNNKINHLQGGPQKCPYFSLAITFAKVRKTSRFFLHRYWKFIEFF